jgi:putative FmdB family regulatory protein
MPIYEYACEKCGHEFEREQRITEDPIRTCPECRAPRARRLISRTSFLLKGAGWYSDLYASPKPAAKQAGDASAKETKEKPTEKKPDAADKSATKKAPETKPGPKAAA